MEDAKTVILGVVSSLATAMFLFLAKQIFLKYKNSSEYSKTAIGFGMTIVIAILSAVAGTLLIEMLPAISALFFVISTAGGVSSVFMFRAVLKVVNAISLAFRGKSATETGKCQDDELSYNNSHDEQK